MSQNTLSPPADLSVTDARDHEFAEAAWQHLSQSHQIETNDIEMTVNHQIATLRGSVPTYAQRIAAEDAVRSVGGIVKVCNSLEVKHMFCLRDEALIERIQACFENSQIDTSDIQVEVFQGTATLRGTVKSLQQKHAIEDSVSSIPGLLGIRGELVIAPIQTAEDRNLAFEITNRLNDCLGIDSSQICVFIKDGRVVLRGILESQKAINRVKTSMQRLDGIRELHCRIRPLNQGYGSSCDAYGHPVNESRGCEFIKRN